MIFKLREKCPYCTAALQAYQTKSGKTYAQCEKTKVYLFNGGGVKNCKAFERTL